jgi:hypothetical protein
MLEENSAQPFVIFPLWAYIPFSAVNTLKAAAYMRAACRFYFREKFLS